jgi:hypothetical protein
MESSAEHKAFLLAGIIWLAFIIVGILQKPIKISIIMSVGFGFLTACITVIISLILFKDGLLGFIAILVLAHLMTRFIFGR